MLHKIQSTVPNCLLDSLAWDRNRNIVGTFVKKKKGNKSFYYTIKYVEIQIQKFFKIAFDCNLESNANSCPKALGISKSSKDIEGGNVSKILDAANDCSELTNCKIHTLYSNSSNVPRQNKVAHKNLNHQA